MMVLGIFLYHSLLEGTWGKTIGKKICGIVVLREYMKSRKLNRTLGYSFVVIAEKLKMILEIGLVVRKWIDF